MAHYRSMQEEFTISGRWWHPEGGDQQRVVGTLTFSPTRAIEVDLYGDLQEPGAPEDSFQRFLKGGSVEALLHGETQRGEPISLLSSVVRLVDGGEVAFPLHHIRSRVCVLGAHLALPDTLFEHVEIRLNLLHEWMQQSGIQAPLSLGLHRSAEGEWPSLLATYRQPPEWEISLGEEGASLQFLPAFHQRRPGSGTLTWQEDTWLRIEPEEPQTFGWFEEKIWKVRRLFTLLTHARVFTLEARGKIASDPEAPTCSLLFVEPGREAQAIVEQRNPIRMNGAFRDLEDPEVTIQRWFATYSEQQPALDLFFTVLYESNLPVRFQFLALAQAVLLWGRSSLQATHLPPDEFLTIESAASAALSEDHSEEFRGDFLASLARANRTSFRTNITLLLQGLDEELIGALSLGDIGVFVDAVDELRTTLTEKFTGGGEERPDLRTIVRRSGELRRVLFVVLLRELAIKEDRIRLALQNLPVPEVY